MFSSLPKFQPILYRFFACDVGFCRNKNVRGASQNIRSEGSESRYWHYE